MTRDELASVLAFVKISWPYAKTEDMAAGYWELLRHFEAEKVLGGVKEYALCGHEFPPPPGVLHAFVTHGPDFLPKRVARRRSIAAEGRADDPAIDPALLPSTGRFTARQIRDGVPGRMRLAALRKAEDDARRRELTTGTGDPLALPPSSNA